MLQAVLIGAGAAGAFVLIVISMLIIKDCLSGDGDFWLALLRDIFGG